MASRIPWRWKGSRTARLLFVAFWCAGLGSVPSAAAPFGYSIAGNEITRLDLGTGAFSTVGTVPGVMRVAGTAVADDRSLYAVDEIGNDLWRIDPVALTSGRIGALGVDIGDESGVTFDACGSLWLATSGRLYRVDAGSGAATLAHVLPRRVFGLTASGEDLVGLVDMGSYDVLARIDPASGAVSVFGEPVLYPTQHQGLDFDEEGRLWGLFWIDGPIPEPWISSIVEFDPATGGVLGVRELPEAQLSVIIAGNLGIAPPPGPCGAFAVEVPTVPGYGLALLAVALGLAASARLRSALARQSRSRRKREVL